MQILALDIGKSKTVGCRFETADGTHTFCEVKTLPAQIRELIALIAKRRPVRVVFEVGTEAGWIADICRELGVRHRSVNPAAIVPCMHRAAEMHGLTPRVRHFRRSPACRPRKQKIMRPADGRRIAIS